MSCDKPAKNKREEICKQPRATHPFIVLLLVLFALHQFLIELGEPHSDYKWNYVASCGAACWVMFATHASWSGRKLELTPDRKGCCGYFFDSLFLLLLLWVQTIWRRSFCFQFGSLISLLTVNVDVARPRPALVVIALQSFIYPIAHKWEYGIRIAMGVEVVRWQGVSLVKTLLILS